MGIVSISCWHSITCTNIQISIFFFVFLVLKYLNLHQWFSHFGYWYWVSLQRQMSPEMVVFYPLLLMLANWLALFCTGYCRIWVWDTHLGSQKTKSSHPRASRTYTLVPIMKSWFCFVFYISSPRTLLCYNFQSTPGWKKK